MAVKKMDKAETTEKAGGLFNKEQLLTSARFQNRRDIINALLQSDKQYTIAAVERMITDYMEGRVK